MQELEQEQELSTANAVLSLIRLAVLTGVGYVAIKFLPLADRLGSPVGSWDEASLRRGLLVLIAVFLLGGLSSIVPKQVRDFLPSGFLWRLVTLVVVTLTFLQYAALDAGQPLIMAEHMTLHLFETGGAQPGDLEVYRHWLHSHLAASAPASWVSTPSRDSVLVSDFLLVAAAWFLLDWSVRMTRQILYLYGILRRLMRRGFWPFDSE